MAAIVIRPQPGPQEVFLSSSADIVFYGGAAGGGKSYALLLETLRHVTRTKGFYGVIFRRNTTHIKNPGGLWDESMKLYPLAGGKPRLDTIEWSWARGGKIKFAHLEYESTVLEWQGSQVALIGFDEITHFLRSMFFYMLSRNRSDCGVAPYIRATCNPDADSWVAEFIEWWIDQETGYAIPERSGVVRWFVVINDVVHWADTKRACIDAYGVAGLPDDHFEQVMPKSFTFIAAKLTDNKILMSKDPGYLGNLKALSFVERERLLGGNWKIRRAAGLYFKRSEVTLIDVLPTDIINWVRHWDLAATEANINNPNPDYTAGVLIGKRRNGRYVVADVIQVRQRSSVIRKLIKKTAENDGFKVRISLPQDPGQAGKAQAEDMVADLAGFRVKTERETGEKVIRADPFAAQWQAGNVEVLRAPWNENYFSELEAFPSAAVHDDQVDASSGAFNKLVKGTSIYDVDDDNE